MRSHCLGVAVQTMFIKRLIGLVAFQPKDAPQVLILLGNVMWMGQYITRKGDYLLFQQQRVRVSKLVVRA